MAVALGAAPLAAQESYRLLRLDGKLLKWGGTGLGEGARVTYAVADRRIDTPGARNCGSIGSPRATLAASGVSEAAFGAELHAAFAQWTRVAGIAFARAETAATADIVIGAQIVPRGAAYTNVEFKGEAGPVAALTHSLICINPERRWKIGFGGDRDVYDLRYVLMHEIGHAIGLDHTGPDGQLMGFRYGETFRAPQGGDIQGAMALYGNRARSLAGGTRPGAVPVPEAPGTADGVRPDLGLQVAPAK